MPTLSLDVTRLPAALNGTVGHLTAASLRVEDTDQLLARINHHVLHAGPRESWTPRAGSPTSGRRIHPGRPKTNAIAGRLLVPARYTGRDGTHRSELALRVVTFASRKSHSAGSARRHSEIAWVSRAPHPRRRLLRAARGPVAIALASDAVVADDRVLGAALLIAAATRSGRADHWLRLAQRGGVGARSEAEVQRAPAPLAREGWRIRHGLR